MERVDYGLSDLDSAFVNLPDGTSAHSPLTGSLGCSETQVDVYRVEEDGINLATEKERICIPIGQPGTVSVDEQYFVPAPGFIFVPEGVQCRLESGSPPAWVVIQAAGDPGGEQNPKVLDAEEQSYEIPSTSDIQTAFLTESIGATGMKVNLRRLEPGQAIPYHVEGRQEELFVPISGTGTMRLAGRIYEAPHGSITRVAPETPRAAVNRGEENLIWLMVGAPPTGKVDWWDPGAEVVDWPM